MPDFVVTDKTLLTSVDRTTDSFLVYDSSATALKRTTVDYALDLTSHPVGIDDSQTLTLKTITAPNISSPVLSGTITGTYTIAGTPTFPSSVVTLTGSQTLTSKVLTSPTINTATIVNPTITVDTISEYTAANGVTVDGLNVKDGKLNTNDSVVTANLTDGAITNAKLSTTAGEIGGAYNSWTPTLTGFSADPASAVYRYTQVGKTVTLAISQPNNGTSNATGFTISLPVTAATVAGMTWGEAISQFVNNSAVPSTPGLAQISSGGTVLSLYINSAGGSWTNSGGKRIIGLVISYEVA